MTSAPPTAARIHPAAAVPDAYDYAIPDDMTLAPGDIVRIPFGRKERWGAVWEVFDMRSSAAQNPNTRSSAAQNLNTRSSAAQNLNTRSSAAQAGAPNKGAGPQWPNRAASSPVKPYTLKPILEQAAAPPLSPAFRAFIDWMAAYTLQPKGAILKMVLSQPDALTPPKRAPRHVWEASPDGLALAPLSPQQTQAAQSLTARIGAGFSTTLLDGATGSGKTEVYFAAIAEAMTQGRQTLVLLPEIALSVQWLTRFRQRFGAEPILWHSDVSKAKKRDAWRAVAEGRAPLVVGARSALFLPFARLGLIIVDEEHDMAFKQEDGVLYHARDMAIARAKHENIPAVLVSATPSLESMINAQEGRYHHLRLPERHAGASFPHVRLIDLKQHKLPATEFLSPPLLAALQQRLASREQSLLFLNRRGYAPLTLCRTCGHRFQCPCCTSWLVLHHATRPVAAPLRRDSSEIVIPASKPALGGRSASRDLAPQAPAPRPTLTCHHCGHHTRLPEACPACGAEESFAACGPGIERLEEELRHKLPQARIHALTSDSVKHPSEARKILSEMEQGAIDILLGTQMIAKGHHFPNLTLVGVVDADLGLLGGDMRASEHTYQLLHQVAGRAGREQRPGEVLIQTHHPGHPVLQALCREDRAQFYAMETDARRAALLPPFARQAAIIVSGRDEAKAQAAARDLAKAFPHPRGFRLLGPAPAPLYKLRGAYRLRLLLQCERSLRLQPAITQWLSAVKPPSSVTVRVDVDPQSFL